MVITPNSTVYLCNNIDLDPNYNFTMDFDTLASQSAFFDAKIVSAFDINTGYSFIRNDRALKVQAHVDDLLGINYLFFNNGNKRYYAFITKKEYINPNCTSITYKIDVMQTFMFDYELDTSFVIREHQNRWKRISGTGYAIYSHTIENIEVGDKLVKARRKFIYDKVPTGFNANGKYGNGNLYWLHIITKAPFTGDNTGLTYVNGLVTNIYYYVAPIYVQPEGSIATASFMVNSVDNHTTGIPTLSQSQIKSLLENVNIISVNISRYAPFDWTGSKTHITSPITIDEYLIVPSLEGLEYSVYSDTQNQSGMFKIKDIKNISRTFTATGYTKSLTSSETTELRTLGSLKNKKFEPKLKMPQFCKYYVEMGRQKQEIDISLIYDNEYNLITSYSVNGSQAFVPIGYGCQDGNVDYFDENTIEQALSLDLNSNELPLRTDAWLNYLAQNKNSLKTGMKTQALSLGAGILTSVAGGAFGVATGIGMLVNAGTSIANQVAKINDIKQTPDTVSVPNQDIFLDLAEEDLFIKEKTYELPESMQNRVFNYLYTYGYSCNDFKKPNTRSRYYFNYIKTIGANIKTNIDSEFKNEIATIYDNGTTIWHYRDSETFNGVNNYDYENVETTILT